MERLVSEQPKKVRAAARVQVTVEIDLPDRWGADFTVLQIQRQAKETALHELRKAFAPCANHNGVQNHPPAHRIVGEPRVLAVLAEEDR